MPNSRQSTLLLWTLRWLNATRPNTYIRARLQCQALPETRDPPHEKVSLAHSVIMAYSPSILNPPPLARRIHPFWPAPHHSMSKRNTISMMVGRERCIVEEICHSSSSSANGLKLRKLPDQKCALSKTKIILYILACYFLRKICNCSPLCVGLTRGLGVDRVARG
jgi:hypothetical protein